MPLQILRRGSEGEEVRRWQNFLIGQGLLRDIADGVFGPRTDAATRVFQKSKRLEVDGCVGPHTYGAALSAGFDPLFSDPQGGTSGLDWPPQPIFPPLNSNEERAVTFGAFRYERIAAEKDDIRILDSWEGKNIVSLVIPQLRGIKGARADGRIRVHKRIAEQFKALFAAWETEGKMSLVLTWEGSFVPRFQRGSAAKLSNHAWGAAFDINYEWNKLGAVPALRGRKGSVRELAPTAHRFGFYWGGHFHSRPDGTHFEVARVLG
jgi:hypothetical protein